MKKLSRSIFLVIAEKFTSYEILSRISDPYWFQSLGSILGFDWNSSGLTTTTLGSIKAGIFDIQDELGIYVCGGKGKISQKTPEEIKSYGISRSFDFFPYLVFASKTSAKVDSALLQDGFEIYHHTFFFTKKGDWAVVQQGMNIQQKVARRYHWIGGLHKNFIEEPHSGIITQKRFNHLNLSSKKSNDNRKISLKMIGGSFKSIEKNLNLLSRYLTDLSSVKKIKLPNDSIFPREPNDIRLSNFKVQRQKPHFNTPYIKKTISRLIEKSLKHLWNFFAKEALDQRQ